MLASPCYNASIFLGEQKGQNLGLCTKIDVMTFNFTDIRPRTLAYVKSSGACLTKSTSVQQLNALLQWRGFPVALLKGTIGSDLNVHRLPY